MLTTSEWSKIRSRQVHGAHDENFLMYVYVALGDSGSWYGAEVAFLQGAPRRGIEQPLLCMKMWRSHASGEARESVSRETYGRGRVDVVDGEHHMSLPIGDTGFWHAR